MPKEDRLTLRGRKKMLVETNRRGKSGLKGKNPSKKTIKETMIIDSKLRTTPEGDKEKKKNFSEEKSN